MATLCLMGHNRYSLSVRGQGHSPSFGEINNALKMQKLLQRYNIACTDVLDIYELFGVDSLDSPDWQLVREAMDLNSKLAHAGLPLIVDFESAPMRRFRKQLESKLPSGPCVILLLTWPSEGLAVLSTGVQVAYPLIVKEDSYLLGRYQAQYFPLRAYAEAASLVVSESLLGAINSRNYGVSAGKFLYLPNLTATSEERQTQTFDSQASREAFRQSYLQKVAQSNQKSLNYTSDLIVVGCPARFVRRKNIDLVIYAAEVLSREFPQLLLLLKGDFDSEFDDCTFYSEKLNQLLKAASNRPWFLWDRLATSYPEVLSVYQSFDVAIQLSGAEIGSNTAAELCGMGVPLLMLDASVNPFLYRGMAEFVAADHLATAPWIYAQPTLDALVKGLRKLVADESLRLQLGRQAQHCAIERFGDRQLIERVSLMVEAASSYHQNNRDVALYRQLLTKQLEDDFNEYKIEAEIGDKLS